MRTERIRIVHCIGTMGVGGAERQLVELITRLPRDRFDQSLVLLRDEGELSPAIEAVGCEVVGLVAPRPPSRLKGRSVIDMSRGMARFVGHLRRRRPHILHAQLDMANVAGVVAGRLAAVPVVATSRLSLCRDRDASTIRQRMTNRAGRSATQVFVNSQAVISDVVEYEGVDVDRLRLIHNGVDIDRFGVGCEELRDAHRRAAGFADHHRVIAAVANLHPYKGYDDLIRAFARLDPSSRDLQLMIVGREAGAGPPARRLAAELGVLDSVRFMGQVIDVENLLSFAELVVHPSHEEGFSNAVIEAMSAGKAVVACDVGGNGEAIVDGETGLLVPARDPAAMATAIERLLTDRKRSSAMGRAGRARVEANFGVDRMIDEFVAWYDDLVANAGHPLTTVPAAT